MSNKILYIDAMQAGISGDMCISALLDVIDIDLKKLSDAILESVPWCRNLQLEIEEEFKNKIRCKRLHIIIDEEKTHKRDGKDIIDAIIRSSDEIGLSNEAKEYSKKVIETMLWAESRIHGKSLDEVHLHEVGSTDTIIDIVGSAYALDALKVFSENIEVYGSPVAVGGGYINIKHGKVTVPAPATLEILTKFKYPYIGGPVMNELATPTGISLLVNLVKKPANMVPLILKPIKVGYGAGTKNFEEIPNVLRIVYAEDDDVKLMHDTVYELETNIDDIDDEIIGFTLEKLYEKGAKDVSIIPIYTKKNRPGKIIKVLCDEDKYVEIVNTLMKETGTLGVRTLRTPRVILKRKVIPFKIELRRKEYTVNVKFSKDLNGHIVRIKPEFSDVSRISKELNIPARKVREVIIERVIKTMNLKEYYTEF